MLLGKEETNLTEEVGVGISKRRIGILWVPLAGLIVIWRAASSLNKALELEGDKVIAQFDLWTNLDSLLRSSLQRVIVPVNVRKFPQYLNTILSFIKLAIMVE